MNPQLERRLVPLVVSRRGAADARSDLSGSPHAGSCTDFHSRRGHRIDRGKKVVRAKGNAFPLEPGTKRAKAPRQEKHEKPLLLNPEIDDPKQHIEFPVDRERAAVIRAALRNDVPSPKGVASIDVYALDRPQLTRACADFALRLLSHLRNTQQTLADHLAKPNDPVLKHRYDENAAERLQFLDPTNRTARWRGRSPGRSCPG